MSDTASEMKLDRVKYLDIVAAEGLPAALTALHRDSERMEFETFEGRDGYKADLYAYLEEVRAFSRELWRVSLGQIPSATGPIKHVE
ncbi:MAG: hypothetical protein H7301_04140 [Cryobacterium sp.]|nr:hypothetical protein [Oligoflexia bacterium]